MRAELLCSCVLCRVDICGGEHNWSTYTYTYEINKNIKAHYGLQPFLNQRQKVDHTKWLKRT